MDAVRPAEFKVGPNAVSHALGEFDRASRRVLSWAMRSNLQSEQALRLKMALAQVCEAESQSHSEAMASTDLGRRIT